MFGWVKLSDAALILLINVISTVHHYFVEFIIDLAPHMDLLLESLHDFRPMLSAGSISGVELVQVFMGTRLWQDWAELRIQYPHWELLF